MQILKKNENEKEKESVTIVFGIVVFCTCHLAKGRTFQVATGNCQNDMLPNPMSFAVEFWVSKTIVELIVYKCVCVCVFVCVST